MAAVATVNGPVDAAGLGRTLMHEHIFVRSPDVLGSWPGDWDTDRRVADAVERLTALHATGIGTIVDLTVMGLGRSIGPIRRVAEQVPLHIVVATGLYTYDVLPHWFEYRSAGFRDGVDVLDELFLRDIEEGIEGTGVRAGILKCATDAKGVTPGVERVLRAVARVHRRTGVPISTHTHAPSRTGLDQQQVFAEEGVDLSRVVIGHCGDSTDVEYLEELLQAGSTLGMDRFGVDAYCPTAKRVETVAHLCERGWAGQLVLSHDASCDIDWFPPGLLEAGVPNWHFLHISNDVIPALRAAGVTEEQLRQMLVDNPRRLLDHGPGY